MEHKPIKEKLESLKKTKPRILKPDGKPLNMPKDGSLGLLALGYKGIVAWKNKLREPDSSE